MQSRFGQFKHGYTDTIRCPQCRSCGVINWDLVATPDGQRKEFSGLSGNFHERLSDRPPYVIEVVCNYCSVPVGYPIQLQL